MKHSLGPTQNMHSTAIYVGRYQYVGVGRLPEWLWTKKDLYALDTVNYNFRVSLFGSA